MKVYRDEEGQMRLIGRADVPDDVGVVLDVALFGPTSSITDRYVIGAVSHLGPGRTDISVERAVIVAEGQYPDFLPGWQPLAS